MIIFQMLWSLFLFRSIADTKDARYPGADARKAQSDRSSRWCRIEGPCRQSRQRFGFRGCREETEQYYRRLRSVGYSLGIYSGYQVYSPRGLYIFRSILDKFSDIYYTKPRKIYTRFKISITDSHSRNCNNF